ncbi:MAG: type VI secretion system baseplate subunit TssE [Acidobacteria bacterium]|nr:type VI secretion system baseplate subunit TssE [Acidobacteriota bacterium]
MAKLETEAHVTPSLLDRLTDAEPKLALDSPMTRAQSVRQLKASLRHDLEWLLNTRRTPDEAPDTLPDLQASLYNYGLPDMTSFSINSQQDQSRLSWLLESTIATFEPRLESVQVSMEPVAAGSRMLRFQIEGMLRMDPAPERISFDTVLELTSGTYQVKGDAAAR